MKRYSLGVDWNSAGRPEPCAKEMSAGRFILFADYAALLRAVAEEVKGMPHDPKCYSQTHCGSVACKSPPWAEVHIMGKPHYFHEFEPGNCNCGRGKVLAMLEVE